MPSTRKDVAIGRWANSNAFLAFSPPFFAPCHLMGRRIADVVMPIPRRAGTTSNFMRKKLKRKRLLSQNHPNR